MSEPTRLAILGAGPIGVEAAARATADDRPFDVTVYEAGAIGEHVRRWSHVRLFSPWELNRSRWGRRRLGDEQPPDDDYPTGAEYLDRYLLPLADSLNEVQFHLHTEVTDISRDGVLKPEHIGDEQRTQAPFLLRADGPDGVRVDEADMIIDATGVLDEPNPLGPGGLPAVGERELNGEITRHIPDLGVERDDFANRRILVVGHGHSAVTTLDYLRKLRDDAPETRIVWAFRAAGDPCTEIEDDPLPERARLDRFGNTASRGEIEGIEPLPETTVRSLERGTDGLQVRCETADGTRTVEVDRIVANVGYRPDISLHRELQVHLCYATDGPMNLAATLMGADSADCLDQTSGGIDTLRNPEPNFFILGAKSYGRNSNFLLSIGFEQIEMLFSEA